MENKVGYSRRNAFVPITSMEEFNEQLWAWCEKDAQRLVAQYRRSYGRNEELYDWTQYVGALLKSLERWNTPDFSRECRNSGGSF